MKRLILLAALLPLMALAQSHSVTLTWTMAVGNPPGTTTSIYRAPGPCTGTPVFTSIATGMSGTTYTDSSAAVSGGGATFCYMLRALSGTTESVNSPTVVAIVPATILPPTGLTVTVQ